MDPQLKRGFLEVCVLASIARSDSYGYQIVKDMPDVLGITESTLYPLLRRMESAGALTTYTIEHNGRMRKYYRITPEGRTRIDEFLAEWADIESLHEYVKRGGGR